VTSPRNSSIFHSKSYNFSFRVHVSYNENQEGIVKMQSLFVKDADLLQSIQKTFENLKKSKENYRNVNSKPEYEISVRRKDNSDIEYFIVNIFNTNKLMYILEILYILRDL